MRCGIRAWRWSNSASALRLSSKPNSHSRFSSRSKIQTPQLCASNSPSGARSWDAINLRTRYDDVVRGVGFAIGAKGTEGVMVLLAVVLIGTVPRIDADDTD